MAPNSNPNIEVDSKPARLKAEYQEILRKNGIDREISEVIVSAPDLKGEHMGSMIELVETKFEGGEESLHFFVKKRLVMKEGGDPMMEEMMKQTVTNEGSFLLEFTKEMEEVCRKQGGENGLENLLDGLFPKVYHYDTEKVVMENLVKRNFVIIPKTDKLDFAHAKLVLENLAKLHGVTHVMIQNAGGTEEFLKIHPNKAEKMTDPGMQQFFSSAFEPSFNLTIQVLKGSSHPEKDETYDILKQYQGHLGKIMGDCCGSPSLFEVICHGDCWSNNIMFEGKGPEHTNLILVDLQMPRVGSPNLDIAYFIFTSVKPADRKRWRELLRIYFNKLKTIVQSLGQSFEFSYEDFEADFVKKSKLGFLFGIFFILGGEAFGGHDAENNEGGLDFANVFENLIGAWVKDNPDKVDGVSTLMVDMVKDYGQFGQL